MDYDTSLAAQYAGTKLDSLINRAHRDSMELVEKGDIPTIVKHFAALRTEYHSLKDKIEKLEAEVKHLSYTIIPDMFTVSEGQDHQDRWGWQRHRQPALGCLDEGQNPRHGLAARHRQ